MPPDYLEKYSQIIHATMFHSE